MSHVAYPVMSHVTMIDRALAAAEVAWTRGHEGKARVCARCAVAYLRRIQQQEAFPLAVRQAAERLTTAVTRRHEAPFTSDPIGDANLIIAHLAADA
ncbi:MAG: hypothetical protein AABZ34_03590 [Nitrospirota bacterium]